MSHSNDSDKKPHLETLAVHAGDRARLGAFIPTATPIYHASSYLYERMEDLDQVFNAEVDGPVYARYGNPTVSALQELMTELEGADIAIATASGMAALHLALICALTDRHKTVLSADVLYGQSITLLMQVLEPQGVEVHFADPCELDTFAAKIRDTRPSCILLEPVSNPLLRVAPVDAICEVAREVGALVIVDSTFLTPILMRPFELGADFVVHSATKYLAGHGDVLGGILLAREQHRQTLVALSRILGSCSNAFDAYLTMRGIKTLPLRMERHCDNAASVAEALAQHRRVERVFFPGDEQHPDRDVVSRLLPRNRYGGMVSFEIADADRDEVFRVLNRLRLVVRSTTLGDVHSLVLYPAMSSHRDLAPRHRERLGIRDNLVRLSVGIEAAEDICDDLCQALDGSP